MTNISAIPGRVYFPAAATAPTTLAVVAGTLYAVPFIVPKPGRVDAIGVRVTTAGSADAVLRLGIYNTRDARPGKLIVDLGEVAGLNTTGGKVIVFNPKIDLSLSGPVWLAVIAKTATSQPTVAALGTSLGSTAALGVADFDALPATTDITGGVTAALAYGPLPVEAPTTVPATGAVPLIGLRATV